MHFYTDNNWLYFVADIIPYSYTHIELWFPLTPHEADNEGHITATKELRTKVVKHKVQAVYAITCLVKVPQSYDENITQVIYRDLLYKMELIRYWIIMKAPASIRNNDDYVRRSAAGVNEVPSSASIH